jgi:hypothetical protein
MTTSGKCWIYKRAMLYTAEQPAVLLQYQDGTEPFNCNEVDIQSHSYPVYHWNVAGEDIEIPLNVPRLQVDSIIKQGSIMTPKGEIKWECLYGKFRSYPAYYMELCILHIPSLILLLFIYLIYSNA